MPTGDTLSQTASSPPKRDDNSERPSDALLRVDLWRRTQLEVVPSTATTRAIISPIPASPMDKTRARRPRS